jgi:hypothetical protein
VWLEGPFEAGSRLTTGIIDVRRPLDLSCHGSLGEPCARLAGLALALEAPITREPMKTKARRVRRWFLVAGGVLALRAAAVLGVYGWAWTADRGTVVRLVTLVDVDDGVDDPGRVSLSARHEAVLEDGRRVSLLSDRGWTTSGELDSSVIWSFEGIEETARVVVGPDEPPPGRLREDMEADHWAELRSVLRRHGVVVDAVDLKRLPHDVVLGGRLRTRIGRAKEER